MLWTITLALITIALILLIYGIPITGLVFGIKFLNKGKKSVGLAFTIISILWLIFDIIKIVFNIFSYQ